MDEFDNDMNLNFPEESPEEENIPHTEIPEQPSAETPWSAPEQAPEDVPEEQPEAEQPEHHREHHRSSNPRRRKRSPAQVFKESYLPLIIAGVALLLIVVFVIGSISRSVQRHKIEKEASIEASESVAAEQKALDAEALMIMSEAQEQAAGFNYLGAIETIDSFSGDITRYPNLANKRAEYAAAQQDMVAWSDPSKITNLSFHMLIADPNRAFNDDDYGGAYNRNFVTIEEFSKILQQLYDNGYILVNPTDFTTVTTNEAGDSIYTAKHLYLPADKKPLMITQTGVNYYLYMTDSDGDGIADKDAAGFASRMIVGQDGKITCEYVDPSGNVVTGAYDLVPILDAFIEAHPDFSYNGARATIAVTGYDGLFGYRTDADTREEKGEDFYNNEVAGAKSVIDALRNEGYIIGCYTYDNVQYGSYSAAEIQEDLDLWNAEVTPILGNVDTMVFAQESDIAGNDSTYGSDTYETLKKQGFHYYLGFSGDGQPWAQLGGDYVRIARVLVTGSNMYHNPSWFSGLFEAKDILDTTRGEVPG